MNSKRFTLEAVEWDAWMPPVDPATATPAQRAALEASPQANSAYFRTLAHDVDSLAERSPLFHAVMYVPRGLKRADRELATVVVSIINGCVYCSSVHARRFVELTKQPEIISALYEQGLDTPLPPRLRAIVDYAAKLTRSPATMTVADLKPLRAEGLDDLEIHDLTNAVAMFANANRLMQTLGEPVGTSGRRMTVHMPGLRNPTARQQTIMRLAGDLAARLHERATENDARSVFPLENYKDLHESGYLRLALPREYDGDGADVFDMVLAQEILARGDASTALVTGMNLSLLGRVMDSQAWPEHVLADICTTLAREGGTINNCVTEAELGSISRGGLPAMTGTRVDGGWHISGRKLFVTGAPVLRFLATAVVLPPSDTAPQGELVSALVEGGSPGLSLEDTWSGALGLRGCGNFAVNYDKVFVPDARIVERVKIGGERKRPGTSGWNLPVAAVYLGIGQAACDAACHYANNRVPAALGAPIAGQPHIQQWIGQIDLTLRAARTMLHDTARAWVERATPAAELAASIATAKYLCTNAACTVTETALRVAGGFSMTRDLPLERYFRDARGGLFQPPQDDLALAMIGRAALDAERSH